jgi:hypothetical protein
MRLIYLGRLLMNYPTASEATNPRLWNLILPGHSHHQSSVSVGGLRQLGIIRGDYLP